MLLFLWLSWTPAIPPSVAAPNLVGLWSLLGSLASFSLLLLCILGRTAVVMPAVSLGAALDPSDTAENLWQLVWWVLIMVFRTLENATHNNQRSERSF